VLLELYHPYYSFSKLLNLQTNLIDLTFTINKNLSYDILTNKYLNDMEEHVNYICKTITHLCPTVGKHMLAYTNDMCTTVDMRECMCANVSTCPHMPIG
jgi:hypothetical protein